MEIDFKYQYTYFIYPYIIEERNHENYLVKILNNNKFSFKIFEKEKDLEIFSHLFPKIRNTMFGTFKFDSKQTREFEKLSKDAILKKIKDMDCVNFEYKLEQDIQGKVNDTEARGIL